MKEIQKSQKHKNATKKLFEDSSDSYVPAKVLLWW